MEKMYRIYGSGIRRADIQISEVQERVGREKSMESMFKEIIENFQNLQKDAKIQVHEI